LETRGMVAFAPKRGAQVTYRVKKSGKAKQTGKYPKPQGHADYAAAFPHPVFPHFILSR
jgi:hypothetical protein